MFDTSMTKIYKKVVLWDIMRLAAANVEWYAEHHIDDEVYGKPI